MDRRKFLQASLILTGSVAITACAGGQEVALAKQDEPMPPPAAPLLNGWDAVPYDTLIYPYSLPALPYGYADLVPVVDAQTMEIHHTKHHKAYIDKLNAAIEAADNKFRTVPLTIMMENLDQLPEPLQSAVRNHGGGHYNHTLFWPVLSPKNTAPQGKLLEHINASFGSVDALKTKLLEAALSVFGSGWAWVIKGDPYTLEVVTTANQQNPLMPDLAKRGVPILGIDVWEHAYYLTYQNRRKDYLEALWSRLNWDYIGKLV